MSYSHSFSDAAAKFQHSRWQFFLPVSCTYCTELFAYTINLLNFIMYYYLKLPLRLMGNKVQLLSGLKVFVKYFILITQN